MPEGPEIRRAADRIASVLVGERIEQASLAFESLKRFEERLTGTRVTAVDTRGKAMLTRFDNDLTLFSHNQLYGRWYTVRRGRMPQTQRSLRVALHTESHSALLYSASDVEVLTAVQLDAHAFLSRLGPDILDDKLGAQDIVRRLDHARFRRRNLAALYLDQAFLAGLGNYLRSEILHRAGLHPALRPIDAEGPALHRLARETLRISRRSYRTGGVTLSQVRRRGKQERFWVFARAAKPCYRCGTPVERENYSGRRLYFCPRCQAPKP